MTDDPIYDKLIESIDQDKVLKDVPMSLHTSLHIGGKADYLVQAASEQDIIHAVQVAGSTGQAYYILGNGSNVLVSDEGVRGIIIQLSHGFKKIRVEKNRVYAEAGALLNRIANQAAKHHLTGGEFMSGIPGSVGGAIYMNAGAFDGEMSQIVGSVHAIDALGNIHDIDGADMQLSYRHSRAMDEDLIILSCILTLQAGDERLIREKMTQFNALRQEKQPLSYPSAGSTFKRPEGFYAGKLIEDCGLRGMSVGGASVSCKHCGFLINEGGASARDMMDLIHLVQRTVYDKCGVHLELEVKLLGF